MVRIALCDDSQLFLDELHGKIAAWLNTNEKEKKALISDFSDASALLRTIESTMYDLFFLDVEMPVMNGLELARIIREKLPSSIIIFVTSHEEFATDGYFVDALRYLTKPYTDSTLAEALKAAMESLGKIEARSLVVPHYSNSIRIPYHEILYVQHILRRCQIFTQSLGTIPDNRGLKEIHALLGSEQFVFIERSTFVNIDHVFQIKGSNVILSDGECLAVSRPMLPKVKLTINRLWGG